MGSPSSFCSKGRRLLLSEQAAKAAKDAAEAASAALALCAATQDGTQQATQASCTRVAVLLAKKGKEARGDGGEDVAHAVGGHAARLRDAADHVRQVAAENVAQNLVAVGEVGGFQVADDVACAAGMVAEGLGQRSGTTFSGGVLLHGTEKAGQCSGDDRRHLLLVDF